MKSKRIKRIGSLFLAVGVLVGILLGVNVPASAAELVFDGTAGSSGGGSSINATGGYAIEDEQKAVVEYLKTCPKCGHAKNEHHHRYMTDTVCPDCGTLIEARACHVCEE